MVLTLIILTMGCGKSLERQVQDQVRRLDGANWSKENVTVSDAKVVGDQATAEITVRVPARLERTDGRWYIREIRLDDRRWESLDRILAALEELRLNDARSQLDAVAQAADRWIREGGSLSDVGSYVELVDRLSPAYLPDVIRVDPWGTPYRLVAAAGNSWRIVSAGSDGKLGSDDDLWAELPVGTTRQPPTPAEPALGGNRNRE